MHGRVPILLILLLAGYQGAPVSSLPAAEEIAEIVADSTLLSGYQSPHFAAFHVGPQEVRAILATYHIVSENTWWHSYAHVLGGDRAGWIVLKNGTRIQWMVRPGGLARLTYPDGTKVHLTHDLHR